MIQAVTEISTGELIDLRVQLLELAIKQQGVDHSMSTVSIAEQFEEYVLGE